MTSQHPAVGIDLGTTYSVVAYVDNTGRPVSIPNESGDLLTPSAVIVDEDEIIVGKEAVKASVMKPEAYAECFKRDMGSASFRRKICAQKVPPEVLSAFVLERLKRDAERRLGSCNRAVVTVPAFFDEGRRRMTQIAGRLAGLEVLDIINEPTAAAVAFGRSQGLLGVSGETESSPAQHWLVYDLGGGTFDVTVLEIRGTLFRTLATDGDVRLGGKDFDQRLVDHLANSFLAAHGIDPRSDPQDATQLWLDAQDVKHSLSERSKVTAVLFHAGIRMRIEVSRSEFEEMTADLLERTETTTEMVVRQAHLDWARIDRVILVGGATRMPMVRSMLRKLSHKEPDCSQSPDESVAHGAALYASELLARESGSQKLSCELINVNSHSLGVVGIEVSTGQRKNVVLIPKNTPLPARASRVFKTAKANQQSVHIRVVEGESDRPEDCIALGECVVRGLPPGLPSKSDIEVEYSYAANGRISVVARVPSVRHSAQVAIERGGLSKSDDLKTWRARLLGTSEDNNDRSQQAAGTSTVDLTDRESVRKRMDNLFIKVGKAALRCRVPEQLVASQRTALSSAAELEDARRVLKAAQQSANASLHDPAALRSNASIAQAKAALEQAVVRADFTSLVLGRECVEKEFVPPRGEREVRELLQLRQQLARLT